jgi:transcriptional regulator with XRE-family HTH domain
MPDQTIQWHGSMQISKIAGRWKTLAFRCKQLRPFLLWPRTAGPRSDVDFRSMSIDEEVERETRRLTGLLESLVKIKRLTVRDIERRLGLSMGTLNKLFAGKRELKVRQILAILKVLNVPPAAFFRLAYEHDDADPGSEVVLSSLDRLVAAGDLEPLPVQLSREDLHTMVGEILREFGILPETVSSPRPSRR